MDKELENSIANLLSKSDLGEQITVSECENFLNNIPKFTVKHTIDETRAFLSYLGNPDENMNIIHVAGTNGKGSVCKYIQSVLLTASYSVGTFTSPHLVKINERFCVDGKPITDGLFCEIFVETLRRITEYGDTEYFPTYFEYLFFMAMLLYDVYPVDYLVMETGLGGRLDATNAVASPLLCVITEIGYDHMQYLGDTLEKIAGEKAGIIKKNVPVVIFDKRPETTEVLLNKALENEARAVVVKKENIENVKLCSDDMGNKFIAFSYNSLYDKYVDLKLSTEAKYQTENASVAVAALEILRDKGADISELDIRDGILSAKWEGRMEEVRPGVYVDGAHNTDGISAFIESVSDISCEGKKMLLFSMVDDKQYKSIIKEILKCRQFDSINVAVLETARSVSMAELKGAFEDAKDELGIIGLPIKYYSNVRDAVTDIITMRKSGDVVFAAGSLYLVGQIKSII
ncbi:MAG: bifunctional folylpolyglutamate synthase/dihydrofolate synthase [Butyrivibrio sp.]|nr:bifunctional folylpolyglutamate synthase/dihydrofolate synthase [Butyrivibrio sp.]